MNFPTPPPERCVVLQLVSVILSCYNMDLEVCKQQQFISYNSRSWLIHSASSSDVWSPLSGSQTAPLAMSSYSRDSKADHYAFITQGPHKKPTTKATTREVRVSASAVWRQEHPDIPTLPTVTGKHVKIKELLQSAPLVHDRAAN